MNRLKKRIKRGEVENLNVTFSKGVAEGWRDERRGKREQLVCVFVRAFV